MAKDFDWRLNASIPPEEFDWSLFEDGFSGGGTLKINKKIAPRGKKVKVFCHESYAHELYELYEKCDEGTSLSGISCGKDVKVGKVFEVEDITPVSDHEVIISTKWGGGGRIDLSKEKDYIEIIGAKGVKEFIAALKNPEYKRELLDTNPIVKVVGSDRLSLWDGHISKLESEFMEQIRAEKDPSIKKYAYTAKIESITGGGYICVVQGVKCFLPGSLAAVGVVSDFESMIGTELPVMFVNYVPQSGFIVSYKKYMSYILPGKIQKELKLGMRVDCRITGFLSNGIFVQFKDANGEWFFTGLVHRSAMSADFEKIFDNNRTPNTDDPYGYMKMEIGDRLNFYISNFIEKNGETRIILSDIPVVTKKEAKNAK